MMIFKGPITCGLSELVLSRSIEAHRRDENDAKARRSSFLLLLSQSRTPRRETDVTIPIATDQWHVWGIRGGPGYTIQVRRATGFVPVHQSLFRQRPCDGLATLRSQRGFDVARTLTWQKYWPWIVT
jgi:hypothetical protein